MSLDGFARTLRDRMPWAVAQIVLNEIELPKSRGWDSTVERLSRDDPSFDGKEAPLQRALIEHLLCGEKLTRFYKLGDDAIATLRRAFVGAEAPESPFRETYPVTLREELLAMLPNGQTLVSVETNEDGIAALFASVRLVTLRERIDRLTLPAAVAEALGDFDDIFGSKTVKLQATDVLWIPHVGNYVDIRIDFPDGMHQDVGEAAHARTRQTVNEFVGEELLPTPVNLFPLINQIYATPGEGRVVEMCFGTTTRSVKHEKMRRGTTCLRDELYHVGGKAALAVPIEPYRLSVEWPILLSGELAAMPELSLNAHSRAGGSISPTILSAPIRRCRGISDFEHVRAKIEHYLELEAIEPG